MTPKNAYCLFCIDHNGNEKMIYPDRRNIEKDHTSEFPFNYLGQRNEHFIFDFHEAKIYIDKFLLGKFKKIAVCKIIDIVKIESKSCFEEEND